MRVYLEVNNLSISSPRLAKVSIYINSIHYSEFQILHPFKNRKLNFVVVGRHKLLCINFPKTHFMNSFGSFFGSIVQFKLRIR